MISIAIPPRRAAIGRSLTRILRPLRWLLALAVLVAALMLAVRLAGPSLLRYGEKRLNAGIKDYSVHAEATRLRPLIGAVALRGMTIIQTANAGDPVVMIESVTVGLDWSLLLRGHLALAATARGVRIRLSDSQIATEWRNPVPLLQKGFQEAVSKLSPLGINRVRVEDAQLTYVGDRKNPELALARMQIVVTDLTDNGATTPYPSPVHIAGTALGGRMTLDGHLNVVDTHHPTADVVCVLEQADLAAIAPIAAAQRVKIGGGAMSLTARLQYGKKARTLDVRQLELDDAAIDIQAENTIRAEKARIRTVTEALDSVARQDVEVVVRKATIRRSTFGFVGAAAAPRFFVRLDSATVRDFATDGKARPAQFRMDGALQGSGTMRVATTIVPQQRSPNFDATLDIEGFQLRELNGLLGDDRLVTVRSGVMDLYSEMHLHGGTLSGRIVPKTSGLDIDTHKGVLGTVVAEVAEGATDLAGTIAPHGVEGSIHSEHLESWQVVSRTIHVALVGAITHAIDHPGG